MQIAIPPTVMVINDDAMQLRLTVAWIKKDGLCVLACQSAEEALRLLRRGAAVDVIVTDLHMPHIDGWRLCHLLHSPEYAACDHVPILVLSATFAEADATRMRTDLGANAFLSVPYDPAILRDHVRDLLAGRMPEERTRALRTSEAQFRLLFESIPDAVFVHDTDGTILAMNEVGAHWLERPAADVVGQPISTLLTPYHR